jgi:carboxypeptidase PM20D1
MEFIEKFREALKIPTWWPPQARDGDKAAEAHLLRFHDFLTENFPAFHKTAERWVINPYAIVYRWPCARKGADAGSVLFLAHYDVVPAETEKWSVDPFGAEAKDGFIYSRGSLDMKNILISLMEAAENLSVAGWQPKKDIWFAFGGDEERTGVLGAMETAKWFEERGQRFDWIFDEGTPVA